MLCAIVRDAIVSKSYSAFITRLDRNGKGNIDRKLMKIILKPDAFLESTSHGNIFSFCGR